MRANLEKQRAESSIEVVFRNLSYFRWVEIVDFPSTQNQCCICLMIDLAI